MSDIHFFSTKERITRFFSLLRKGNKEVEKNYSKYDLINIAKDLGADFSGKKSEIIQNIRRSKFMGPNIEESLYQDILDSEKPAPAVIKTYQQMSLSELKKKAESDQLISTGSKAKIIRRIENLDNGTSPFEDSTTDWLRKTLSQNRRLTSGSRKELLSRLERLDDNILLEDLDYGYLKEIMKNQGLKPASTRDKCLLALYPLEIKILKRDIESLEDRLSAALNLARGSYDRKPTYHSHSFVGQIAKGALFGAIAGIAAHALTRRRFENKTTLKF